MIGYAVAIRNSRLTAIRDAIDAGTGAGTVKFYTGTRPATGGTATTLLATVTCSDPCAPAPASGVLTFSAFTEDTAADATGTATWARVADSAGTFVADMSVSASGGGGDIIVNSTSFTVGVAVQITSMTITEGNA